VTPQLSALARTAEQRGASPDTLAAISQASRRTGVSFAYLVEKAAVESSFRPDARASTSSAVGLYQFTAGTWLDMVRRHGADVGLGAEANALAAGSDTPLLRQRILKLREDAGLSAHMAALYAADNKATVEAAAGRPATDTDLYLAHFLGPRGASTLLAELRRNPAQPASTILPEAAAANRNVFFDNGRPVSLLEVYDRFSRRFDRASAPPAATANALAGGRMRPAAQPAMPPATPAGNETMATAAAAPPGRYAGLVLSPSVAWALSELPIPGSAARATRSA